MGKIVIACYKPIPGKEKRLDELVKSHIDILKKEGLVTERKPIVMRATDGTIVEVFEWKSATAIEKAHNNPEVLLLWEKFEEVCTYEAPSDIEEFGTTFPEFEPF